MTDFSQMTDEELIAAKPPAPTAAQTSSAPTPIDFSKMSDEELMAAQPAKPRSTTEDVIKEGAKGLGRGLAGAVGDIGKAIAGPFGPSHHFANLMADFGLTERPAQEPGYGQQITKAAGIEAAPQTTPGRYAGTVGEFVGNPESYLGPGGMLAKAATAAGGAVGSEAAGDLGEKFAPDGPKTQAAMRLIGAIAGGHGATAVPRLVTPNIIPREQQAMIDVLKREGVPMTAGDRTGNLNIKAHESELSEGTNDAQRQAFERAAFNRVGETIGDKPITGKNGVVNTMMNRVGGQFDTLGSRNTLNADPRLSTDLTDVYKTYNDIPGLYSPEVVNSVNGAVGRVQQVIQNGGILSGPDYLTLRSSLRKAAMNSSDSDKAEGLHDVTNALDRAMERSVAVNNPQDAGAFSKTFRDYRNALVLQDWAGAANRTPATLAQSAKKIYGKNQYTNGMDDFSDLADAGKTVLKQYQDSGTTRRGSVKDMLRGVGGGVGAAIGSIVHHDPAAGAAEGSVLGLLLGEGAGSVAARPLLRKALMNRGTQGYLANQALPFRLGTSPTMEALVNQIKGGQTGTPPVPGAKKAKDGKWYVSDPNRPNKFLEVRP